MATIDKTFSKSSFDYASYASKRPSYPPSLIDLVLRNTPGPKSHLLDLGCGHGVSTRAFAPHFTNATGTDPSPGMLAAASSLPTAANIAFAEGTSTTFPAHIGPASVDLVISSQAAHWFPWPDSWDALARIVRPGGTVALWGYSDPTIASSRAASEALHRWAWGTDGRGLGKFWIWPGRGVVEKLYADVVSAAPAGEWERVRWVRNDVRTVQAWFAGEARVQPTKEAAEAEESVSEADRAAIVMRKKMTVAAFKDFVRTWSSYNWWAEAHPDDKPRAGGGTGDVADWMVDEMMSVEPGLGGGEEKEWEIEWPTALILATRRA